MAVCPKTLSRSIPLASPERARSFDMMADLSDFSEDAKAITGWMKSWFDSSLGPAEQLKSAMGYSALSGGKRLRGGLVLACRRLAATQSGRSEGDGLALAAAVEMLHAYSLIHDDLPAMDDADLRRGQPSAHLAYDEATAILAGDALQTAAFQLLADPAHHPDAGVRAGMVLALAEASGLGGMAGGQMLDLQAEAGGFDLSAMQEMQDLKTGALIRAACRIGGLSAHADDRLLNQLDSYACHLGLAFQIADDLLDIQGMRARLASRAVRIKLAARPLSLIFWGLMAQQRSRPAGWCGARNSARLWRVRSGVAGIG